MKTHSLQKVVANLLLAVLLIAIGIGINATYQTYQGTGLSRLPKLATSRVNRAQDKLGATYPSTYTA